MSQFLRQKMLQDPMVHISNHPLILANLALVRDKNQSSEVFRTALDRISSALFYEALSDLRVASLEVETPLMVCTADQIIEEVVLVPVMRAGLGMIPSALRCLPDAAVYCLGMERDEATSQASFYYNKLTETERPNRYVVIDPMLATGGSAIGAITVIKEKMCGSPIIQYVGIIASPEGASALTQKHPDVHIYLAAMDDGLNAMNYIKPGLGDAGKRVFNTDK